MKAYRVEYTECERLVIAKCLMDALCIGEQYGTVTAIEWLQEWEDVVVAGVDDIPVVTEDYLFDNDAEDWVSVCDPRPFHMPNPDSDVDALVELKKKLGVL